MSSPPSRPVARCAPKIPSYGPAKNHARAKLAGFVERDRKHALRGKEFRRNLLCSPQSRQQHSGRGPRCSWQLPVASDLGDVVKWQLSVTYYPSTSGGLHMPHIEPRYHQDFTQIDMNDEGTINDYLDAAAQKHALTSDRQLARELGVTHQALRNWRKFQAWPSDQTMVRIAAMAEADTDDALLHLNYWRSKDPVAKDMYRKILSAVYHVKGPNVNHWMPFAVLALVLGVSQPIVSKEVSASVAPTGATVSLYYGKYWCAGYFDWPATGGTNCRPERTYARQRPPTCRTNAYSELP